MRLVYASIKFLIVIWEYDTWKRLRWIAYAMVVRCNEIVCLFICHIIIIIFYLLLLLWGFIVIYLLYYYYDVYVVIIMCNYSLHRLQDRAKTSYNSSSPRQLFLNHGPCYFYTNYNKIFPQLFFVFLFHILLPI